MKRTKFLRKQTCHWHVLNRIKLDFQVPAMSARETDPVGKFFKSTFLKKRREKTRPTVSNMLTFLETHSSLWFVWWDYKTFCCHVLHQLHTFSWGLIIRVNTNSFSATAQKMLPRAASHFSKCSCCHEKPPRSEQMPWREPVSTLPTLVLGSL